MQLSNKEFSLLRVLASDPTRVFSKEELLRRGLGLPHPRPHPHARLPRQPAAAQTRPRAQPLRRQLLGRRLPAGRRMTDLAEHRGRLAAGRLDGRRADRSGAARRAAAQRPERGAARAAPPAAGDRPGGSGRGPARRRWSRARCELAAAALERLDREINGGPARRGPRRGAPAAAAAGCGRALAGAGGARPAARWSCAGGPARRSSIGDRSGLAQALDNLIVNAIEHGGPSIVVEARPPGRAAARLGRRLRPRLAPATRGATARPR